MSSKVITEVSDNKANATSPSHCPCLQVADRELFQGNNLPADQKQKAQERNWEQFKDKFAVYPEDYRKQQIDIENGGLRLGVGVFVREQEREKECVCVCVRVCVCACMKQGWVLETCFKFILKMVVCSKVR